MKPNSRQIDKFLGLTDNLRHHFSLCQSQDVPCERFLGQTVKFQFDFCTFSWNRYDCSHRPTVA